MTSLVTDQGIIHYEAYGRGRPVILLHGWMESWAVWREVIEALGSEFRLYALDFWGFGESDPNAANAFTVDHYVEMVREFLDSLGIVKAPLIGHSMGGTVALSTAMRYPEKIVKVMVIGSPIHGSSLNVLLKLSGVSTLAALLFRMPPVLNFFTFLVSQMATQRKGLALYRMVRSEGTQISMHSFFQSIGTLRKTDLRARLPEVRTPTMGIYGRWDFIVHPNQNKVITNNIPGSKALIYPGCGHLPMLDTPDRFLGDIRDFLVKKDL